MSHSLRKHIFSVIFLTIFARNMKFANHMESIHYRHFPMSHSSCCKNYFLDHSHHRYTICFRTTTLPHLRLNRNWLFLFWGFSIPDTSPFLQHPDILLFGCTTFHVPGHKLALFPLYIPIFSPGTWNMEQKVEIILDKHKLWEAAPMRTSHCIYDLFSDCA